MISKAMHWVGYHWYAFRSLMKTGPLLPYRQGRERALDEIHNRPFKNGDAEPTTAITRLARVRSERLEDQDDSTKN